MVLPGSRGGNTHIEVGLRTSVFFFKEMVYSFQRWRLGFVYHSNFNSAFHPVFGVYCVLPQRNAELLVLGGRCGSNVCRIPERAFIDGGVNQPSTHLTRCKLVGVQRWRRFVISPGWFLFTISKEQGILDDWSLYRFDGFEDCERSAKLLPTVEPLCAQGFQHAQAVEHCGDARSSSGCNISTFVLISKSWQVSFWGPISRIIRWFLKIWSTAGSKTPRHRFASLILLPFSVWQGFFSVAVFKVLDFEEIWVPKNDALKPNIPQVSACIQRVTMWSIPTAGVIRRHLWLETDAALRWCCCHVLETDVPFLKNVSQPMTPIPDISVEGSGECSGSLSMLMIKWIKHHLPWQILDDWCDRH